MACSSVYAPSMDPLAGLLDGPRARGAFVLRSLFDPPWCLRIEDDAPLTLVAVARGSAWIGTEAGDTARLTATDIAVVRGPGAYRVADDSATPVQVVIGPGQVCTTADGRPSTVMGQLGPRSW